MHLLITRPEADAREMKRRLEAGGHQVTIEPLLEIEAVPGLRLAAAGAQAVVVTSRNALKAIEKSDDLQDFLARPLVVVGPGTAGEAEAMGFTRVIRGAGKASDLVALIKSLVDPSLGSILLLAGDVVAFDLEGALTALGYRIEQRVVYRSSPVDAFTASTVRALREGTIGGVVLMSPRTAETYARLVATHMLQASLENVVHFCISAATAARLEPLNPLRREVSVQPNLEEMLALIGRVAAKSDPRS